MTLLILPYIPMFLQYGDVIMRLSGESLRIDGIMDVVQVSGIAVAAQRGFVQMGFVHADVLDGKA
jgi:hypothetical protein